MSLTLTAILLRSLDRKYWTSQETIYISLPITRMQKAVTVLVPSGSAKKKPNIVKFWIFKTKVQFLFSGLRLKGARFSLSEHLSLTVRAARKASGRFAIEHNSKFNWCFDILFIGSKPYIYDRQFKYVKKLQRMGNWGVSELGDRNTMTVPVFCMPMLVK